ncbi:MAG TPA: ABC transporter permease [Actinomycetota bacterium]|nr:ABC transporter permease [Actinomycetota bacterium]
MATAPISLPTETARERPEWLDKLAGQALAILIAVVIALGLGSLIILGYGESPLTVYGAIFQFGFGTKDGFGYVLTEATPLIFSALAVAVCFKAGMFNIGVEGQYLVGMVTASWAALKLDFLPGPLLMWVVILFGMLGGIAFALVPAILKVRTGAHEVVTTIMMNGIAISLVAWALAGPLKFTTEAGGHTPNLRTDPFPPNARIPDLGHLFGIRSSVHLSWLFVGALVTAAIIWFVLKRSRLGYEGRAVGASAGSARAGGISIGSVQLRLFILSGALAGLVGMQQLLGDKNYLPIGYEAALGFTGIAVAFLGQNSAAGIVAAAIVWGVLARGETAVQIKTDVPREFVIILQGILIISVVVTYQLAKRRLLSRQLRRAATVEDFVDSSASADIEGMAQEDR